MSEFDTAPAMPTFERERQRDPITQAARDFQEGRSVLQEAVIAATRELSVAGAVMVRIDPDPNILVDSYRVTFEVRPGGCGT